MTLLPDFNIMATVTAPSSRLSKHLHGFFDRGPLLHTMMKSSKVSVSPAVSVANCVAPPAPLPLLS